MGLLDRAQSFKKGLTHPENPKPASIKGGLLARATQFKMGSGKPRSLLRRAEEIRNIESPGPRKAGLLSRALSFKEKMGNLSSRRPSRSLLARAEKIREASFFESQPPSNSELPEWNYEGSSPSPPVDEVATAALYDLPEEDIFDALASEAESDVSTLSNLSGGKKVNKKDFLYDDDEFSTTSLETHIAGQKKVDNYLTLFDISKEISTIDDLNELWESILYAIMGQLGSETIVIFSANQSRDVSTFYPVAHSGFEIPDGWILRQGDEIFNSMRREPGVKYVNEFRELRSHVLKKHEKDILGVTNAALLVPLKSQDDLFGILFVGPQLSGDDYSIDDIEFLNLLGEIVVVAVSRILSKIRHEKESEELQEKAELYESVFSISHEMSGVKNIHEMRDILHLFLTKEYNVDQYSLVLLNPGEQKYRLFGAEKISDTSMEKFQLDVSSNLIALISNLTRIYEVPDFKKNRELSGCYTNDDITLMDIYHVIPLVSLNWLVGYVAIHRLDKPWSKRQREMISTSLELISPVFAAALLMGGAQKSIFRDPFSPVESRLREEMKRTEKMRAPVSLVVFQIKNLKHFLSLSPTEEVSRFLADFGKVLSENLFETDYMGRISQGKYAIILPGRTKKEAITFEKKIRDALQAISPIKNSLFQIQLICSIISAPNDTSDPEQMLSILE